MIPISDDDLDERVWERMPVVLPDGSLPPRTEPLPEDQREPLDPNQTPGV